MMSCKYVELCFYFWENGAFFGVNLAKKKKKHINTMIYHLIAKTNWGYVFANETKFQSVKSKFSNLRCKIQKTQTSGMYFTIDSSLN